jgi:hypothetical protein
MGLHCTASPDRRKNVGQGWPAGMAAGDISELDVDHYGINLCSKPFNAV